MLLAFVRVWVILFSQLVVRLLYFFLISIFTNSKHCVVVRVEMVAGGEVSGEVDVYGSATEVEFGSFRNKLVDRVTCKQRVTEWAESVG